MTKPRRKADIRRRAEEARAALPARPAPVPPPPPAHWTDRFLAATMKGAGVGQAARMAGVARATVYAARHRIPGFAQAIETARHEARLNRCRTVRTLERIQRAGAPWAQLDGVIARLADENDRAIVRTCPMPLRAGSGRSIRDRFHRNPAGKAGKNC